MEGGLLQLDRCIDTFLVLLADLFGWTFTVCPNRPSTFVNVDAPTEAEKEALRLYDTRQLQLFSRRMMCLPKQLMLVAQQGQPTWGPNGREALDKLDEYYHDHDPARLSSGPELHDSQHEL